MPVKVEWLQGKVSWRGFLSRVEKYDPSTRSLYVVVSLPEGGAGDGTIRPQSGMFCRVEFSGLTAEHVVSVPRDLVRQDRRVAVLGPGDRLQLKKVRILRWQGSEALVEEGLSEGDRLILSPLARAVEGMTLKGEPE